MTFITHAPRTALAALTLSLALAGPAVAQTDTLGEYTTPTDVVTTPTPTTPPPTTTPDGSTGDTPSGDTTTPTTPVTGTGDPTTPGDGSGDGDVAPDRGTGSVAGDTDGDVPSEVIAATAASPVAAGSTPQQLAFTGAEAWVLGFLGLALMGGAVVLQRRRSSTD